MLETRGKLSTHGLRFLARYGQPWTLLPSPPQKKGPKTVIFPTHVFWGIYRHFPDMGSYSKRHPKGIFHQRSHSKGPDHALEEVLTSETPDFCAKTRMSCQDTLADCLVCLTTSVADCLRRYCWYRRPRHGRDFVTRKHLDTDHNERKQLTWECRTLIRRRRRWSARQNWSSLLGAPNMSSTVLYDPSGSSSFLWTTFSTTLPTWLLPTGTTQVSTSERRQ